MSDHCQFLVIPVGGPVRIIDSHPHQDRVSDELSAIPVPILPDFPSAGLWVRETCATEGQPRNVIASLMLRILSTPPVQPVLGPAVLTRIVIVTNPGSAYAPMLAEGFPREIAESLVRVSEDMRLALTGADSGFSAPHLDGLWAMSVRAAGEQARTVPIPEGWPRPVSEGVPHGWPDDPVAVILAKLGLGGPFAPVPIPG